MPGTRTIVFRGEAGHENVVVAVTNELELALTALAEVGIQRQRAEANFRKAMDGVGYQFGPLLGPEWSEHPVAAEIRRKQAEQALDFCRTFLRDEDADSAVRLQIGITYISIGGIFQGQGEHARAQHFYREAIQLFTQLVAANPRDELYQIELAQAYNILGLEMSDTGRHEAAKDLFGQALEQYRGALRARPDSRRALHLLAWFHVVCPDSRFRDPSAALKFAKAAIEKMPESGMFWNTLGIAYYRAGQYPLALNALEKSITLQEGGDSLDWFFLAMTHWQLGNKDQAREWYTRALEWRMEKNRTCDLELRLFRTESDALFAP